MKKNYRIGHQHNINFNKQQEEIYQTTKKETNLSMSKIFMVGCNTLLAEASKEKK